MVKPVDEWPQPRRPFNAAVICPKCGYDRAVTWYRSHSVEFGGFLGMRTTRHPDPHMTRKCARCDYSWQEKPLDMCSNLEGKQ